jgi:hypothetical protein
MSSDGEMRLPSDKVLKHVAKLSVEQDKPIMMDYWADSYGDASVLIGVRNNDTKMLVRSPEEYTSPISKIFKVAEEFIVITENSIYIVSAEIPTKRIT